MQAEIISLLANNMFIFTPLPHQKLCQSACTTTIANNWIITQTRPWSKKKTRTQQFFSQYFCSLDCIVPLYFHEIFFNYDDISVDLLETTFKYTETEDPD